MQCHTAVSIVIPHYNSKLQLICSLLSLVQYVDTYDFEIVIVDNGSDLHHRIRMEEIPSSLTKYVQLIQMSKHGLITAAYNEGFRNAIGDVIIIQNAFICHNGDIIKEAMERTKLNNNYIVFSVFNSPHFAYNYSFPQKGVSPPTNLHRDKRQEWLSHPVYNRQCFHYLSAVRRDVLYKMCGFDERLTNNDDLWKINFIRRMSCVVKTIQIVEPHVYGLQQFSTEINDSKTLPEVGAVLQPLKSKLMVSIVMAFFNRKQQLLITLDNFESQYANKYKFEVVIVDDCSNEIGNDLTTLPKKYSFPIQLCRITEVEKGNRVNPCVAYNRAIGLARGDILIIQNPECLHCSDIIGYSLENLKANDYLSFSCYSNNTARVNEIILGDGDTRSTTLMTRVNTFLSHTNACDGLNENLQSCDIEWLNSPTYKTYFHYCGAIFRQDLERIGAFDERFKNGVCFDDDDFVLHLKSNKINMVVPPLLNSSMLLDDASSMFVMHQYHKPAKQYIPNYLAKHEYNQKIYNCKKLLYEVKEKENADSEEIFKKITKCLIENKIYKSSFFHDTNLTEITTILNNYLTPTNFYSARKNQIFQTQKDTYCNIPNLAFTYWDMSNLSYLHFMTLFTFKKHHPDYDVVLYYPTKRVLQNTWKSFENKEVYNDTSFLQCLNLLDIITIEIDFETFIEDIPYYLSEVIKSDFFRLYVSKTSGGIWFDMDTFWINRIPKVFYANEYNYFQDLKLLNEWYNKETVPYTEFKGKKQFDLSYFVVCHAKQHEHEQNFAHFCQYVLMHNKESPIVKMLYDACVLHLNIEQYESIGTPMFSKLLSNVLIHDEEFDFGRSILNIDIFAPYKWHEMNQLFELGTTNTKVLTRSACLHWFNGSPISKQFIKSFKLDNTPPCAFTDIYNTYITAEDRTFLAKMHQKVSIVMAYYNRKQQLIQTIESIKQSAYKNIELVIVDDCSDEDQWIDDLIVQYPELDIKIITISKLEKCWVNPCVAYNKGFEHATGDIIVVQNPEVRHVGDCISYIVKNLCRQDWISFNCYGSPSFQYNDKLNNLNPSEIYNQILKSEQRIGGNSVERDEVGGWLNHFDTHFTAYHYLAAIYKADLFEKLDGGFDDDFRNGVGADDDEFIKRLIYHKFQFKISEFKEYTPFAIHLYHAKPLQLTTHDHRENKEIFKAKCLQIGFFPENNIHVAPSNEVPMHQRVLC